MGSAAKPKRESSITLCALFFALALIIMSIWNPDFHWPPPPVVGGGGESGGAGASGGWEPEGCPIINTPWDIILEAIKADAGTLYNDELWTNSERALVGRFFIDVVHSYWNGTIIYNGDGTWDFQEDYQSSGMYHSPYTGAVYEGRFFTRDDTLPGALPVYITAAGSVVRDSEHSSWLSWDDYRAAYFLSEEWQNSCFVWYDWSLLTCLCSLPLPWGQGGARGGAEGQILTQILGLSMSGNAIPAIDIVSKNARRSRRHRLLGGSKEIL